MATRESGQARAGVSEPDREAAEALSSLRGSSHESTEFMRRVQAIPLVSSALEVYERKRQTSAIVRVGGNVIGSGVRRMCEPIARRIDVGQLDSFACRQLSNLGYPDAMESQQSSRAIEGPAEGGAADPMHRTEGPAEGGAAEPVHRTEGPAGAGSSAVEPVHRTEGLRKRKGQEDGSEAEDGEEDKERRGWGVVGLVASARERAVAYRADSMRRLRYCLEWVVYATALLAQHVRDLRALMGTLQAGAVVPRDSAAAAQLARVRREIVGAVRRAVGVVSHYAGSVLPGETRRQVRGLILGLPGRWALADPAAPGSSSSAASSVDGSPRVQSADAGPANIEAMTRRTLALATESFTMLDSLRGVFVHLQTNAERWVGSDQPDQPVAAPQYREPSGSAAQSPAPRLPPPLPPPPPPSSSGGQDRRLSVASLVDIGEQMRRMDMASPSPESRYRVSYLMNDDEGTTKRSRTREPTPTRM
ncbi:transcriptional regulator opi1 [Coemansia sp. RSA 552]|nr:transcriptional regulator opi1 [Coemansia sp. RSA 552]